MRKRKSRREGTRKAGGEREHEQERKGRRRQTASVKARLSARDAQDESDYVSTRQRLTDESSNSSWVIDKGKTWSLTRSREPPMISVAPLAKPLAVNIRRLIDLSTTSFWCLGRPIHVMLLSSWSS